MSFFACLSDRDPRYYDVRINMLAISQVRSWLHKQFQAESSLLIERLYEGPLLGARNRVALRVTLPGAIAGEIDVAWLYALRKKRLEPESSRQRLISKLQERESERAQTVA